MSENAKELDLVDVLKEIADNTTTPERRAEILGMIENGSVNLESSPDLRKAVQEEAAAQIEKVIAEMREAHPGNPLVDEFQACSKLMDGFRKASNEAVTREQKEAIGAAVEIIWKRGDDILTQLLD